MRTSPSIFLVTTLLVLSGCQTMQSPPANVEPQPVAPQTPLDPLATHLFTVNPDDDVVGEIQITRAGKDDTLSDIARRFNLGYEELVRANPGVDPWVPGEGREIVLPTQFVLPEGPREGIVVNLAALRLFYFPKHAAGQPQTVITHPIGIGKVGWTTPEGTTKVLTKKTNPTWTPPASVRKEHAEHGDPLPKVVPPGDDNPLGAYAMNLGWAGYLIHGTNKPYGVGMRSSHGCMRLYPEDIALLYKETAIGTPVRVVNQRLTYGWHDNDLYVKVMPPAEEEQGAKHSDTVQLLNSVVSSKLVQQAQRHNAKLDLDLISQMIQQPTGVAMPVTKGLSATQYLAQARHIENRVPAGATWDGNKELMVSAAEFEAMHSGAILPKKETISSPTGKKASKQSL